MKLDAQVAIVGAGPIGIELAVALKKAGIDYLQFDGKQIGYTVSWFAPQTRFFSSNERIAIAGVPLVTIDQSKCTREQYLAYLRSVVTQFDLKIHAYEPVTQIAREGGGFVLTTRHRDGEKRYRVEKVVLATGGTARPRRLNVPGEDLPHVSHYFADPHEYFGQRLHIIGGKNSAVEAALRAQQAGAIVSMSHRRAEFDSARIKYWLWPEISGLIKAGRIAVYFNSHPEEIRADRVILRQAGNARIEVPADFVLALIGYEADMTLCRQAGVELDGPGSAPRFDPGTMLTSVPGLYVAGTAIAGTQERFSVFIENCHVHVDRILASLTGQSPPHAPIPLDRPES
ncbi:MAG: NAD(P)-binding domain-containing protein [Tepidisphaeraceae bacterium]|jgi:thioredoxin reductase (NADPH)